MAPGLPNGQGKGVGQGLRQKDGTRVRGNWVGWGLGLRGQGLGPGGGGILISPRNILRGIL